MTRFLPWGQPIGAFSTAVVAGLILFFIPNLLYLACVMGWIALAAVTLRNLVEDGQLHRRLLPALRAGLRWGSSALTKTALFRQLRHSSRSSPTHQPQSSQSAPPGTSDPRDKILAEGIKGIEQLHGLGEVRRALEDLMDATAHSDQLRNRMQGLSQGTLFILSGPRGTGRMTVAANLAKLLYGIGLTEDKHLYPFPSDKGRNLSPGDLYDLMSDLAEGLYDHLVVFENADWLLTENSAAVGRAFSDAARRAPGRLWIVLIGSEGFGTRFKSSSDIWTSWQKAFVARDIAFPELDDSQVAAILEGLITKSGIPWERPAQTRFMQAVSGLQATPSFANAITVRQLFEGSTQAAASRIRSRAPMTISPADVDRAADQIAL